MNKQYGGETKNAPDFASVKESVQTLVDHGGEAVHEHPGKSVALAFGIGYVAMRIRTNFLFPFAVIGGIGLLVKRKLSA